MNITLTIEMSFDNKSAFPADLGEFAVLAKQHGLNGYEVVAQVDANHHITSLLVRGRVAEAMR